MPSSLAGLGHRQAASSRPRPPQLCSGVWYIEVPEDGTALRRKDYFVRHQHLQPNAVLYINT